MKRKFFTLTEMLVVIAIIAILSALVTAAVIRARASARTTKCVSNQGQTIKLILAAMNSSDSKITNGNADGKRYTDWLRDKNLISTLEAVRCPELNYSTKPEKINTNDALKEAYGMVISSVAADYKFNFKNNKLLKSTVDIPRNNMLMGGDCIEWKTNAATSYKNAAARAALDFDKNRLAAIHSGNVVNLFFLDGSVSSLTADEFKSKTFHYPKADCSGPDKVNTGEIVTQ